MNLQSSTEDTVHAAESFASVSDVDLPTFNRELDQDYRLRRINESRLERRIEALEASGLPATNAYRLTLARLTELALLCAGEYIDSGELQAAGDLLFNLRRILVHIEGRRKPVLKKRHFALGEQFRRLAGPGEDMVQWLKRNTRIEIAVKPVITHLFEALVESGHLSDAYLDSVRLRSIEAAQAINIVSACHVPKGTDFRQYIISLCPEERAFIESNLCRFDNAIFFEMGLHVIFLNKDNSFKSRFLQNT